MNSKGRSDSIAKTIILGLAVLTFFSQAEKAFSQPTPVPFLKKIEDIVIYKDARFYSSFPSIVRRPDGELIVAFRRAPDRRNWGGTGYTHTDPNSYLVLVRSRDQGNSWTSSPELIYANPFGGSQDPCMVQLRDNSILCASYGWAWLPAAVSAHLTNVFRLNDFVALGGWMLRSRDGAHSWEQPITPPSLSGERFRDPSGKPVPAGNRGAMCEGKNGRLFWAVPTITGLPAKTETRLLISADKGATWKESCVIATDPKITFNETSLYETPRGDLVAFTRTENFNDHTVLARSRDAGKSFEPWQDAGFQGHPHHVIRLPDQRVLLVYGYRHPPFGIRARILDSECTDFASAREFVLREDGAGGDLGYPWVTMVSGNRALVVYYFQLADGIRHIAGTFVEMAAGK